MNRNELMAAVAGDAGCDQAQVRRVLASVERRIMQAVKKNDPVSLTGFGTFERRDRRARTARNLQTGLPVKVKAARVPAFRAGIPFREVVAGKRSIPPLPGGGRSAAASASPAAGGRAAGGRAAAATRSSGSRSTPAARSSGSSRQAEKASRAAAASGRKGSARAGSAGDLRRGSRSRS